MISSLSQYLGEIKLLGHKLANRGNRDMQIRESRIKHIKEKNNKITSIQQYSGQGLKEEQELQFENTLQNRETYICSARLFSQDPSQRPLSKLSRLCQISACISILLFLFPLFWNIKTNWCIAVKVLIALFSNVFLIVHGDNGDGH